MLLSDYYHHQSGLHHPFHYGGGGGGSSVSAMSGMSNMSSDTMSGSVVSSTRQSNRMRTVRLVRPNSSALPPPGFIGRHGPNLGFSIRGGREHGTGFFVSHVELGSEAHRQGLRVGDQIVRINGFTVEDAVHKEVLQLISNHTHIALKVRSVGMIPVKEKRSDPLSWQIISDCNSSTRSSPQLGEKNHDIRITIHVAPRSKLGCGICKGPDWKPGIFIQFTKEGGIAREAGLRPGDQILACNGVDFADIAFNEAVALMKSSRQLDLAVRKSAGSELFPGESSGYNSSASSVTGDQSPSWSDSKRLSIVKEESMDLEDRLAHLQFANSKAKKSKWEKIEWDDVDAECDRGSSFYKPTIINLSEHGTTIKNNGSYEEYKPDVVPPSDVIAKDTKTVVVEIHRTDEIAVKPPAPNCPVLPSFTSDKIPLSKTSSISSFTSTASRNSSQSQATSLSSAISQELLRRSEKQKVETTLSIDEQLQMKKSLMKNVDTEKQQQHHKLMDEFRKAHKKMFKSNGTDCSLDKQDRTNGYVPDNADRLTQLINSSNNENNIFDEKAKSFAQVTPNQRNVAPPPPPLPINGLSGVASISPLPQAQSTAQNQTKPKQKAPPPPVPIKTSTLSSFSAFPQPPPCPTPDYDTLSLTSNSTLPRSLPKKPVNRTTSHQPTTSTSFHSDAVEMESLDSFAIHNPASNPSPPSTYFHNDTMDTSKKPLSNVTIGEYASSRRRMPGKFDFLNGTMSNMSNNESHATKEPINSQFASELAQTLSRSNLRRRTESMENLLNHPPAQITRSDENGSVRISVNNNANRLNLDALSKALSNRVKINVASDLKRTDMSAPNGILKNAQNGNGVNGNGNLHHRSLVHQKSITFGEMPTVITDEPLHVS